MTMILEISLRFLHVNALHLALPAATRLSVPVYCTYIHAEISLLMAAKKLMFQLMFKNPDCHSVSDY